MRPRVARRCLVGIGLLSMLSRTIEAAVSGPPIAGVADIGTTAYPNGGMAEVGSFSPFKHEDKARCAIASPDGTRAWIGLLTKPGIITELDLTTMTKTGSLELGIDEGPVLDAAIDPAGQNGYFLLNMTPARIVHVDLATFSRMGSIDLLPDEVGTCLTIDHAGVYLYVGVNALEAGRIVRIELASQARKDAIQLPVGDRVPEVGVVDSADTYAYFINSISDTRRLIKIRLADFLREDYLGLEDGVVDLGYILSGLRLDPGGQYAYITGTAPPTPMMGPRAVLLRVHLDDFITVNKLSFPLGMVALSNLSLNENGSKALAMANGLTPFRINLVDFTTDPPGSIGMHTGGVAHTIPLAGSPEAALIFYETEGALITKIDFDLTRGPVVILDGGEKDFQAMIQDADGRHCYLVGGVHFPNLVKIDQRTTRRAGSGVFDPGGRPPAVATSDGRYGYVGTAQDYAHVGNAVFKIDLEHTIVAATHGLQTNISTAEAVAYNSFNGSIYVSSRNGFGVGVVGQLDSNLSAFTPLIDFIPGQHIRSLVADPLNPDFYFLLQPNNLIGRYHGISGMTDYGNPVLNSLLAVLRDTSTGHLYGATVGPAARIYDFDPATLQISRTFQASLIPGLPDGDLRAGAIDRLNRFDVYLSGTAAIVKHNTSDFQHADFLPISYTADSTLLDPDGYKLFTYEGAANLLHKIRLTPRERIEGTRFTLIEDAEVNTVKFYSHAAVGPRRVEVASTGYDTPNLRSGIIDREAAHAWFGTAQSPGSVVEFNTETREVVRTTTLASGENDLACGAISPDRAFGYFGTNTSPGQVVEVRLSDLTRTRSLPLLAGEANLQAAAVEPAGTYAYFADGSSPAKIVKVRLSDLARIDVLTLNAGEVGVNGVAIDPAGGFLYASCSTGFRAPGVVKIRLSDFTRLGVVPTSGAFARGIAMDPSGTYMYAATATIGTPGLIDRIRLSDFTLAGPSIELESNERFPAQLAIDAAGTFLFVGCTGTPARIVTIDLASFTRKAGGTLRQGLEPGITSILIDASGDFGFLGLNTVPGKIVTVEASPKPLRLALYRDFDFIFSQVWQSPPLSVDVANAYVSVPISEGTPSTLMLRPGNYLLAWQFDADESGPSFVPGSLGDGIQIPMQYGPFPGNIGGAGLLPGAWTETPSRWSAYIEYDVPSGVRDWAMFP